jgi:hypothetical protein
MNSVLKMDGRLLHIKVDPIQKSALINDHALEILENVC